MASYQQDYMKSDSVRPGLIGLLLVYALLLTSLIGKSYLFAMYRSVWTVQMVATVVLIAAFWSYFFFAYFSGRLSPGNSGLKLRLRVCLFLMLLFAVFSCCAQENPLMNLAFLAAHASAIMILFVLAPRLIPEASTERFLDIVLFPLALLAAISVGARALGLGWSNWYPARLNGLFGNAIIAGQMLGITSILLFWKILYRAKRKSKLLWSLFIVSVLGVLMTRTRTDIAGVFAGITACLLVVLWRADTQVSHKRAKALVLVFIPLSIITLFWAIAAEFQLSTAREYLRLRENLKETIQDRQVYWERGLERVAATNIFGNGPLDKFGDDVSLSRSSYDIDSNAHNALLSVIQYYGWPGGLLFVLFLLFLLSVFLSKRDRYSVLGISILAFGLVQCISENWLLSFGTPLDLYCWFLLGWCLSGKSCKGECHQAVLSPVTSPDCFFWGNSGLNKKVINVY